ncbi:hypothetical protein [Glaciimonas sp. PAMC28666]|uniref:hypothetical protein n=1 Tax=Glaciimonas sp. PAMC28666 TaxID=2807626 RepID=UPI0019665BC0|nr:hypothetical protein [Glaciimonas sp. PAMC28666]QRX82713.1 hypothetical protein JQN73_22115 [Glaciimonas sp. PAMC28666]
MPTFTAAVRRHTGPIPFCQSQYFDTAVAKAASAVPIFASRVSLVRIEKMKNVFNCTKLMQNVMQNE